MLTVVCFKWFDPRGRYNDRFVYTAEHVNRLQRMVARNLSIPHDFVCVTDDAAGLDPAVGVRHLDPAILQRMGNRYAKLTIFRPDAGTVFGERLLMLDLDTVITGSLDPLVERSEDFVAWQDPNWGKKPTVGKYNSSMVLLRAGSFPQVWEEFAGTLAGAEASAAGPLNVNQSDQALIFRALGSGHPVWTGTDGVLSFNRDVVRKGFLFGKRDPSLPTRLPRGARVVFFHSGVNFTAPDFLERHSWVAKYWQ